MKPEQSGVEQRHPPKPEKPKELKQGAKHGWDKVDEASWESFPASDPPAHWAGNDKPPTLNGEEQVDDEDVEDDEEEEPGT